ncbi:phospholipase A1-like [Cataglyphis hispanica]|uniref:phospholipase A1-like n=1 Tax=Cataglyphis hispanica TaxID=1086592 RepID=UPI00217FF2F1|nr:phospholipase A1-like [Cataglyphis hispanica]
MRNVAAILIIFLVPCVYLYPEYQFGIKEDVKDLLNSSCIFGPQSMSMVLFNSDNPKGKNIGEQESCSYIDPSKPIVFLVHGFISSANNTNNYDLASQLIKNDYTVFSLDWSDAACSNGIAIGKLLEYPFAVKNTREIGELMAKYVITLKEKCKIPLDNITFIGHSLGAHVAGFASKDIQKSNNGTISCFIGLDPAGPMFEHKECKSRFCNTDAKHVIAFHTSILGMQMPVGDIDLWFNGGKEQPDCDIWNVPCSHSISVLYLANMFYNKCVYPGAETHLSKLLGIAERPSYPNPNTTDCVVINKDIVDIKANDELRGGNYYVFVQKKYPYCTEEHFSCKSLIETS